MNLSHLTCKEPSQAHKHSLSVATERHHARSKTEPVELPLSLTVIRKVPTQPESNGFFQAKSLSLIRRINQISKQQKKRRTMTQNSMKVSMVELEEVEIIDIAAEKQEQKRKTQIRGLITKRLGTANRERLYQRRRSTASSVRQVATSFLESQDYRSRNGTCESLKIDFNKNDRHLFSRSRRKVLAVDTVPKKIIKVDAGPVMQKGNEKKSKFCSFSKVYYERYMRHYVQRKNLLKKKDWIQQLVKS